MRKRVSLDSIGIHFSDILIPTESSAGESWAVVACDQFTSDAAYWDAIERAVGTKPSTLRLVLPERYLDQIEQRLPSIHAAMERYVSDATLRRVPNVMVHVERTLSDGTLRSGLVAALDLEHYDYDAAPDSAATVRASERTIATRLPARAAVRNGASLETTHVIVLYDDPDQHVVRALQNLTADRAPLYHTELLAGGGAIRGKAVPAEEANALADAFSEVHARSTARGFTFLTGDGNHALAAAKQVWEAAKTAGAAHSDPRRYSLVELINAHDPGFTLYPIHRVVRCDDEDEFLKQLIRETDARYHSLGIDRIAQYLQMEGVADHEIAFVGTDRAGVLSLATDDTFVVERLDAALERNGTAIVEYEHDRDAALQAAAQRGCVGLVLPAIQASVLFTTIAARGVLPRKAFSVGHARDKRYYFECRGLAVP